MITLFKQIGDSSQIDDLDAAIRPIQDIIGQDDGGVASMFFSGEAGEMWPAATVDWRTTVLVSYVQFELQHRNAMEGFQ